MGRIESLRQQLDSQGIDGLLVTAPVNRRYISGFTGSAGLVLISRTEQIFMTDFRYIEQVTKQCPSFRLERYEQASMCDKMVEVVRNTGVRKLGFEQDDLTYGTVASYRCLEREIAGLELVPTSGVIETLRLLKDEQELASIQAAAEIADRAFTFILDVIAPGVTERDVALELETYMRRQGASGPSFSTIVASGVRSSLPHGVASDKTIERGDFVTLDYGALVNGYASDITRTVVVGEASTRQRDVYQAVLAAQEKALNAARAGMTGEQLDAVARDHLATHGLAEMFGHSLGHGLGLDVHEQPRVAKASQATLQSGMVITIEPGVYIPGWGGVRIEDDIFLAADGCQILTHAPKQLITL